MSKRKQKRPLQDPQSSAFGHGLAAQLKQLGLQPTVSANEPETAEVKNSTSAATADPLDLSAASKIVLRRETKRRRGKVVTVISGIQSPPADLTAIAKALRQNLGCGSTVEQDEVLLQGDQLQRAQSWLESKGARKIVLNR